MNDSFYLFNLDLIKDGISYSIKDYIVIFRDKFYYNIELSIGDINFLVKQDNEFCVKESSLPKSINLKKIIKKYDMIEGVDFIKSKEFKHSRYLFMSGYKLSYIITPKIYKKILILSDNKFVNYYLFLEKSINAYQDYQLIYNRNTLLQKNEKIQELNNRLVEKELEIMKMRNSINICNPLDINYLDN